MGQTRITHTQPFPIYYGASVQFQKDGGPSGEAGATAKTTIEVNNMPQSIVGIRIANTYELVQAAQPLERLALRYTVDDDQMVGLQIVSQNITFPEVHQRTLIGLAGFNWHPLAVAFQLRGANKIQVAITRRTSYPLVQGEPVLPTADITIVSILHTNDNQEGSAPPSYRGGR